MLRHKCTSHGKFTLQASLLRRRCHAFYTVNLDSSIYFNHCRPLPHSDLIVCSYYFYDNKSFKLLGPTLPCPRSSCLHRPRQEESPTYSAMPKPKLLDSDAPKEVAVYSASALRLCLPFRDDERQGLVVVIWNHKYSATRCLKWNHPVQHFCVAHLQGFDCSDIRTPSSAFALTGVELLALLALLHLLLGQPFPSG